MPKPPNPVFSRFRYDGESNMSFCKVGLCLDKIVSFKGHHGGNLTAHLRRFHQEEYEFVQQEKVAIEIGRQDERSNCPPARKKRKIGTSVEVFIDEQQVIEGCVSLVTESGRPFKALDDYGFRMILDPVIKALGGSFTVSAENIVPRVNQAALDIREKLKSELKNQFVCLKVDCAKRLSRSILGINVQFIQNDKLVLRTLSTYELKDRQTGATLKAMILDVLKQYSITLPQVYSITTDNGANILLAVKLLSADANLALTTGSSTESDEGNCSSADIFEYFVSSTFFTFIISIFFSF